MAQVEYLSDGFLEKNRDTVYEEQINILKASKVKSRRSREGEQECPQPEHFVSNALIQPVSRHLHGIGGRI